MAPIGCYGPYNDTQKSKITNVFTRVARPTSHLIPHTCTISILFLVHSLGQDYHPSLMFSVTLSVFISLLFEKYIVVSWQAVDFERIQFDKQCSVIEACLSSY